MKTWRQIWFHGLIIIPLSLGLIGCSEDSVPTSAPSFVGSKESSSQIVPDQYIVVFKEMAFSNGLTTSGHTPSQLAHQLVTEAKGNLHFAYEHALKGFAATLSSEAVTELEARSEVDYIEPDKIMSSDLHFARTQTPVPSWGLDRIDQRDLPLNDSYRYIETPGVHVYILDTGIRETHWDFGDRVGNCMTVFTDDFGCSDCDGSQTYYIGHGTYVAGIAGGWEHDSFGVAKGVTLHPVRVLWCNGGGQTSWIIAGVDWVKDNFVEPAVANMSFSGVVSLSLEDAIRDLIDAGVTVVVSAGKGGGSACNFTPARMPEVITVGASTQSDEKYWDSTYGTCVDIFAPGENITSDWNRSDNSTTTRSGTSAAAPHVTGVAARYLWSYPTASPADVRQAIIESATEGRLSNIGPGSPNLLVYSKMWRTSPIWTP